MAEQVTGAQSLVSSLEAAGADVVFGIPGGAILPAYDPLFDSELRHILVRHEQGAGHAAEGYARATGRVGVCMAHLRSRRHQPGHPDRRRLHGLGADRGDHRPGRQRRASARTPSRRRTSAASRCRSPSTTSWCSTRTTSHGRSPRPFHIASTGRPGPVLVDIPKDMPAGADVVRPGRRSMDLPGYKPTDQAAQQAGQRGRPPDHRGQATGVLRGRRRAQVPRARRARARWWS